MSAEFIPIPLDELQRLTNEVPVMLASYDIDTKVCVYANAQFAGFFGLTLEQVVGKSYDDIVSGDAKSRIQPMARRARDERVTVCYSRSVAASGGGERWIEINLVPSGSADGARIFVSITDITEHRRALIEKRGSNERLRKFMAASLEGIAFHADGIVTDVNPPLLRMLGYSFNEVVGRAARDFLPPSEHAKASQMAQTRDEVTYESFAIRKDGFALPVEYTTRNFDLNGEQQRLIIVRDLSERRAAEQRIHFLALHDSLTGLPNRVQLSERLNDLIDTAQHHDTLLSVFFIDLDQLKRVNDSLGHDVGDKLLSGVANRLLKFCESANGRHGTPWLARLGGDEFVIVLPHQDRAGSELFSRTLQDIFKIPIVTAGRQIRVTASVGVATFPHDGTTPAQLMKNADAAMYLAKAAGRDTTRFFDQSIALAADNALIIEDELDYALRHDEFELFYQPEVSADGTKILGVEALIRWRHRTRGLLGPDAFIPIAEGLHLILPIGQWVLDTALAQVPRWRALGWKQARVSVNLSSNQFRAPGFTDSVLRSLTTLALGGECLELEVTERMLMSDDVSMAHTLHALRRENITLSIDDFGTGYSSLSRLRKLPIEKLKIDRSFVEELPGTHSAGTIVNSILELAQGLGLKAMAEGVETEAQRECLEALGCRSMQGYLFARPMPAADFCQWLTALLDRNVCATRA